MHEGDDLPRVTDSTSMREAIYEMSAKKLGITAVTDSQGLLVGCISDGDLRRMLEKDDSILGRTAGECMTADPLTIDRAQLAPAALKLMEDNRITSLFVCDQARSLEGIIHLHDLWRLDLF